MTARGFRDARRLAVYDASHGLGRPIARPQARPARRQYEVQPVNVAKLYQGAFDGLRVVGNDRVVGHGQSARFQPLHNEPPGPVEIVAPRLRLGWFVLEPGRKSP